MGKQSAGFLFFGAQITTMLSAHNGGVTDQLSLSIWLEKHAKPNRLSHFEALLRLFPFSQRDQPQSTFSVSAIDTTEPPLLERPFNGPADIAEILPIFRDFRGEDVAYRYESWWDLWQFDRDWAIKPGRVVLSCFGPDFDNGTDRTAIEQEDLRIDFGVDSNYLPQAEVPSAAKLIESNIKSLLRLVHEIDSVLPVKLRRLETESGENFAERLQQRLTASGRLQ